VSRAHLDAKAPGKLSWPDPNRWEVLRFRDIVWRICLYFCSCAPLGSVIVHVSFWEVALKTTPRSTILHSVQAAIDGRHPWGAPAQQLCPEADLSRRSQYHARTHGKDPDSGSHNWAALHVSIEAWPEPYQEGIKAASRWPDLMASCSRRPGLLFFGVAVAGIVLGWRYRAKQLQDNELAQLAEKNAGKPNYYVSVDRSGGGVWRWDNTLCGVERRQRGLNHLCTAGSAGVLKECILLRLTSAVRRWSVPNRGLWLVSLLEWLPAAFRRCMVPNRRDAWATVYSCLRKSLVGVYLWPMVMAYREERRRLGLRSGTETKSMSS